MKRWMPRLLILVGVMAALLLATELVLALSGLVPDPESFTMRRMTTSLREDADGRFTADDSRWFTTSAGFRLTPAHVGRDATADWPFRGRPGEPLPSPASLPRVLVVGDSCVYGASLDPCDTLGWRLQLELDARGLQPQRVAVIPLGVPGYSTEQILPLLRWGLATLQPDAVVLYPAAWNDQAPAVLAPDRELLDGLVHPGLLDWLRHHTRIGAALMQLRDRVPQDELLAGWRAGQPPNGWRVPAEDVGPNVAAMIAACTAAGAVPVVVAPPQPDMTRADHPRLEQDGRAVLAAAAAAGVTGLDGQEILRAAGGDPTRFFSDYVHPSPDGIAALVPAIAGPVEAAVRASIDRRAKETPASCMAPSLEILDVQPREAFSLGDVTIRLKLDNWNQLLRPPVVLVGGAPLVGVHAVAMQEIEGTLTENGPGLHDILVQSDEGVGLRRGGLRLLDPVLTLEPGPPPRLVVRARPGDRLRLLVDSVPRDTPQWSFKGALRLDTDARPLAQDVVLDAEGLATIPLPAMPLGRVLVQAMWAPAGEDLASSPAARWTGVIELGG